MVKIAERGLSDYFLYQFIVLFFQSTRHLPFLFDSFTLSKYRKTSVMRTNHYEITEKKMAPLDFIFASEIWDL